MSNQRPLDLARVAKVSDRTQELAEELQNQLLEN